MRKPSSLFLGALVASLFWAGMLVGRSSASIGAAVANAHAPRWDYNCIVKGSVGDGTLTQNARDLGKEGWELAMGIGTGLGNGYVLCFKRPLPP
jgi:hypothetical protein